MREKERNQTTTTPRWRLYAIDEVVVVGSVSQKLINQPLIADDLSFDYFQSHSMHKLTDTKAINFNAKTKRSTVSGSTQSSNQREYGWANKVQYPLINEIINVTNYLFAKRSRNWLTRHKHSGWLSRLLYSVTLSLACVSLCLCLQHICVNRWVMVIELIVQTRTRRLPRFLSSKCNQYPTTHSPLFHSGAILSHNNNTIAGLKCAAAYTKYWHFDSAIRINRGKSLTPEYLRKDVFVCARVQSRVIKPLASRAVEYGVVGYEKSPSSNGMDEQ